MPDMPMFKLSSAGFQISRRGATPVFLACNRSGCPVLNAVLIDLTRQNRGKLVRETLKPRLFLGDIALEFIVGDQGRDRREEPDRRREKRLRYARRDERKRSIVRRRDGAKRGH